MTRRDYELIASTVNATKVSTNEILGSNSVLRLLSSRLADGLAHDNPRFDTDRFMAACGFPVAS